MLHCICIKLYIFYSHFLIYFCCVMKLDLYRWYELCVGLFNITVSSDMFILEVHILIIVIFFFSPGI